MEIQKCTKSAFSVIGKEGSTENGADFVDTLWKDANSHFSEVSHLAKKDEHGNILGVWGLMSDFSKSFKPWEDNFSKGLYLAGVEVTDGAEPPHNWVKWEVLAFEYLYAKVETNYHETFKHVLDYMKQNNMDLAGAVFDYI
jgi:predicted transcriptional regulator YdeE